MNRLPNFYLDELVSRLIDEKGYEGGEFIKNIVCNSCYFGLGKEYTRTIRPGAGFQYVLKIFRVCLTEFFCNSLLGFQEMALDLIEFLGYFMKVKEKKNPVIDLSQMKGLFEDYKKLFGQFEANPENLTVLIDLARHLERSIKNSARGADLSMVRTSQRCFGSPFFARLLATIQLILKPGTITGRIVAFALEKWEKDHSHMESDYRVPFNLKSILKRPKSTHKLITSKDRNFQLLRKKYALISKGENRLRFDVNAMLIYSGFETDVFTRQVDRAGEDNKHSLIPGQMSSKIFENFDKQAANLDLMHQHFNDDVRIDEQVAIFILNHVLKTKPVPKQIVKKGIDPIPVPLELMNPDMERPDYTKLQFYGKEKALTSSINPIWILLIVGVLCYFLFV